MDLLFPQLHFIGRDFLCDKVELYQVFLKVFEFAKKSNTSICSHCKLAIENQGCVSPFFWF